MSVYIAQSAFRQKRQCRKASTLTSPQALIALALLAQEKTSQQQGGVRSFQARCSPGCLLRRRHHAWPQPVNLAPASIPAFGQRNRLSSCTHGADFEPLLRPA
jgi:hypothetical protein